MLPTLNRLSEQEEDDDDEDDDDDGDYDNQTYDELLDNVSRITATTSSEFKCHTGADDSKIHTIPPPMNASLRKRRNATSSTARAHSSKCVQFRKLPHRNDDSPRSTHYASAEMSEHHSKPLKKIIFNGTFPIDDPYSSRF